MEDLSTAPWLRRLLVAALLAGLALLTFEVLKPFIVPLIWAVILAHVTWPVYRWLLALCRQRHTLAALLMTLAMSAAIVLPAVWLVSLIRSEVVVAYAAFTEQLARGVSLPRFLLDLPVVGPWLEALLTRVAQDPGALNAEIRGWLERSIGELGAVVGGVGRNLAKLMIAMLSLFFMYRDGAALGGQVVRVLEQFLGGRVHGYTVAISGTVRAVVYGLIAAAIAQGTLAALGYWAAGLNAPVTLGAVTTLAAFIPFLTPTVWISASVWLLITGKTAAAIGLFLWGAIAVSWIDNIVRPVVISNATRIPFLLVLFGVLGGVLAFGLVGLFVGPVILAVLMAVWREWLSEKRATA